MTVQWDSSIIPSNVSYSLVGLVSAGITSGDGSEQRVFRSPGIWRISYDIFLGDEDQVLAWGAMLDRMRTGENILLPLFIAYKPKSLNGNYDAYPGLDYSAFETQISINTVGMQLKVGYVFTYNNRLYRIVKINGKTDGVLELWDDAEAWDDETLWVDDGYESPDQWSVDILPPLRDNLVAGSSFLDFLGPKCICKPQNINDGDALLERGFNGNATLTFIEEF